MKCRDMKRIKQSIENVEKSANQNNSSVLTAEKNVYQLPSKKEMDQHIINQKLQTWKKSTIYNAPDEPIITNTKSPLHNSIKNQKQPSKSQNPNQKGS